MTTTTTDRRQAAPGARWVPALLTGCGVALLAAVLGEWTLFAGLRVDAVLDPRNLAGLATSLPFVLVLLVGGPWLARSRLPAERYRRVAAWTFGALAVFVGMNALTILAGGSWSQWVLAGWLRWAAAIGGSVGFVIGVTEARAIERVREATRARTRAEQLETHRQWLDHLNAMLRHEVLNAATVIQGNVSLLLDEEPPPEQRERLNTIRRQCTDTAEAIEDVRALLRASEGTACFEPTDLRALLQSELRALRDRHPHVTTETDIPEELLVEADPLLSRVFTNLFANAVEHNDCDPVVAVEATREGDRVVVRVSDDGPGVPEAELATLFERGGTEVDTANRGLGLYLVRLLVKRHGGEVELADNEGGATFAVELPAAEADAGPEPSEAAPAPDAAAMESVAPGEVRASSQEGRSSTNAHSSGTPVD